MTVDVPSHHIVTWRFEMIKISHQVEILAIQVAIYLYRHSQTKNLNIIVKIDYHWLFLINLLDLIA
jgi:hypothetical protein